MLKFLSSSRITVICLFLLFVLTFWGTIAQVQQGLYVAQERFFNSFFFLAAGVIPFPGAQLVLWVLFINLMAMMMTSLQKLSRLENVGLLIIHVGLILYFFAAFMVFHVYKESNVHLTQGQGTNISASYTEWELAYWTSEGHERQVIAIDTTDFKPGYSIPFTTHDFTVSVDQFYLNSDEIDEPNAKMQLVPKAVDREREQNIQSGIFNIKSQGQSHALTLYGAEGRPTALSLGGQKYYFILRHKRFELPFTIRLKSFKAEFHPGTQIAKSFESMVTLTTAGLQRQVRIYMNNPLRYKDYTVYQASYDTDQEGRQYSTLAVVKNFARVLPYIACFVVFFGLALHFLIQAFMAKGRL